MRMSCILVGSCFFYTRRFVFFHTASGNREDFKTSLSDTWREKATHDRRGRELTHRASRKRPQARAPGTLSSEAQPPHACWCNPQGRTSGCVTVCVPAATNNRRCILVSGTLWPLTAGCDHPQHSWSVMVHTGDLAATHGSRNVAADGRIWLPLLRARERGGGSGLFKGKHFSATLLFRCCTLRFVLVYQQLKPVRKSVRPRRKRSCACQYSDTCKKRPSNGSARERRGARSERKPLQHARQQFQANLTPRSTRLPV